MWCVIYLDFPLTIIWQKQTKKEGITSLFTYTWVTTVQLYPGRDTFEFDHGHMTKNRPITVIILLSESLGIQQWRVTWCCLQTCLSWHEWSVLVAHVLGILLVMLTSLPWDLTYKQVRLSQIWTNRIFNSIQSLFFTGSLIQDKACFLLVM